MCLIDRVVLLGAKNSRSGAHISCWRTLAHHARHSAQTSCWSCFAHHTRHGLGAGAPQNTASKRSTVHGRVHHKPKPRHCDTVGRGRVAVRSTSRCRALAPEESQGGHCVPDITRDGVSSSRCAVCTHTSHVMSWRGINRGIHTVSSTAIFA